MWTLLLSTREHFRVESAQSLHRGRLYQPCLAIARKGYTWGQRAVR